MDIVNFIDDDNIHAVELEIVTAFMQDSDLVNLQLDHAQEGSLT